MDKQDRNDNFFESIPLNGDHYIYRDDAPVPPVALPSANNERSFAIITLLLIAIVAVAVGLLLAWGLSTLQTTAIGTSLLP